MKTVLSLLLLAMFGGTAFGEDLKIYAAAALKAPLADIVSQYEASTGNKVTFVLDTAGATEQRFREDPQAGLLITTVPVINDAEKAGRLKGGTTHSLGVSLPGLRFLRDHRNRIFPRRKNLKPRCFPRNALHSRILPAAQRSEFIS